jgi:hypothetical protein
MTEAGAVERQHVGAGLFFREFWNRVAHPCRAVGNRAGNPS